MGGGTIVFPAEHLLFDVLGVSQVIVADDATNETTTLYTVPTSQVGYLLGVFLSIVSTSLDFEQVTFRWTDDSETENYDWVIDVSPYDTFHVHIPFKLAIQMDEDDTLKIISADAKVTVSATANILLN
jgi:hypothetical protein